jgi:hypothetical protein
VVMKIVMEGEGEGEEEGEISLRNVWEGEKHAIQKVKVDSIGLVAQLLVM